MKQNWIIIEGDFSGIMAAVQPVKTAYGPFPVTMNLDRKMLKQEANWLSLQVMGHLENTKMVCMGWAKYVGASCKHLQGRAGFGSRSYPLPIPF